MPNLAQSKISPIQGLKYRLFISVGICLTEPNFSEVEIRSENSILLLFNDITFIYFCHSIHILCYF